MPCIIPIQIRRGTAAEWTSENPVLSSGELGFETDTNKMKVGDGINNYNDINYINYNYVMDEINGGSA